MRFKSQITIKRLRAPVVAFDLKLESSDTQLAGTASTNCRVRRLRLLAQTQDDKMLSDGKMQGDDQMDHPQQ